MMMLWLLLLHYFLLLPVLVKIAKLETTEYKEDVQALNVTNRCLRVKSVTTKKSNGVIFDIVQFFGIQRDRDTGRVAFVLGVRMSDHALLLLFCCFCC